MTTYITYMLIVRLIPNSALNKWTHRIYSIFTIVYYCKYLIEKYNNIIIMNNNDIII